MPGLLSPPSHPGTLCGWGRRQQVLVAFLSYTTRKSHTVTQAGISRVAELTIWGPTFTLIGPKVFGKILVGELVLETGNAITEILPKKSGKRRLLNYFLSNLWKTLWQILTSLLTLWNQIGFVSFVVNTPSHNLQTSQQMSQGHLTKLHLHYFIFKITCILFSETIYSR